MAARIIRGLTREQWMDERQYGIGSSEVGTILGLNPFETPYQLWRRKKGLDAPKAENFAMRAGHYLEDAVSKFYEYESGRNIIKSSVGDWLAVDATRDYLRVSPDRTFWVDNTAKKNNENKGICECKTTQMKVDSDNIPQHWFCQLTYQLGVCGYSVGSLAWLTQGREFGYKDFVFDSDFYDFMVGEIDEFWHKYIVGDEEPLAYNAEDVILKAPRHTDGKTITATDEITQMLAELATYKGNAKEQNDGAKVIENELKLIMADAESIADTRGRVLVSWKSPQPSAKFDVDKFRTEHPDIYSRYTVQQQGARRFLIK